jgi:hypothetical protein
VKRPLIGLLLVALVGALWLYGLVFFGVSCRDDCGDQGGRGVFLLLTLASPLGLYGALLAVRGTGDRTAAWLALSLCAAGAAVVAVFFLAAALEGFVSPDTSNSDPDYGTPAVYTVLGAVWSAIAWLARAIARRARRHAR